jgi:hypothetical protein
MILLLVYHETLAASARRGQCLLDESSMVFVTQDKRAVMLLDKNAGLLQIANASQKTR